MYVLLTYKDEENQMKIEALQWSQHYSAILKTLKGSLLCSWWSSVAANQTHLSFYGYFCYLQE